MCDWKAQRIFLIFFAIGLCICSSFTGAADELINSSQENADYAHAQRFLPANTVTAMFNVSVDPHWLAGTPSFWYLKNSRNGQEFMAMERLFAGTADPFDFDAGERRTQQRAKPG